MFVVSVSLLSIIVVALLSLPLIRKKGSSIPMGPEASIDQERIDLEIERQTLLNSLAELDLDLAQSKFLQKDYDRLKAVDERHLLNVLNRLDQLKREEPSVDSSKRQPEDQVPVGLSWVTSVVVSVLVIGSGTWIYSFIQSREEQEQIARQQPPQGMPNPVEMVARLEGRLKENPNDLEGQLMIGRSYMALQRIDDAKKAYAKVLELDSRNHEGHYNLGVILLQTSPRDDQNMLKAVINHFNIALVRLPREPVLLWYKGVALIHLKRYREADESWTAAFQELMPGSEDAEFVKRSLQSLRAGNPPLL